MSRVGSRALSAARTRRTRNQGGRSRSTRPTTKSPNTVQTGRVPVVSEKSVQETLDENNGRAKLLTLFKGEPGKGHVVTVPGMNPTPDSMDGLHESAAAEGKSVHTLAMDDMGGDLDDISSDLKSEIEDLQDRYPGESITIKGHSMGGRVAADAAHQLDQSGKLRNTLKVDLYNPMLGGTRSGNWAKWAPGPLKRIPGVRPGVDMGSRSTFQKRLENSKLGPKVKVSVKVGSEDKLVNDSGKHFQRALKGLNATVKEVPGAGHDDIDEMAKFGGN